MINTGSKDAGTKDWELPVPTHGHHRFYDVYRGEGLRIQRSHDCLVKSCGKVLTLKAAVEARGIGALLKIRDGKISPREMNLLRKMGAVTVKPLKHFADQVAPLTQSNLPGTTDGTVSNVSGMPGTQNVGLDRD